MNSRLATHCALVTVALLFLIPSRAGAGLDDLRMKNPRRPQPTVALSIGPGFVQQQWPGYGDVSEPGLGLSFAGGLLVHRRASVRFHAEGVLSATDRYLDPFDVSSVFVGGSVQWWAHDWLVLAAGFGRYRLFREQTAGMFWSERDDFSTQNGAGWLLSLGVPLEQFDRMHYHLVLDITHGRAEGDSGTTYHLGWQWQWR